MCQITILSTIHIGWLFGTSFEGWSQSENLSKIKTPPKFWYFRWITNAKHGLFPHLGAGKSLFYFIKSKD